MENTTSELATGFITHTLVITESGETLNDFWNQTLSEVGLHCAYASYAQWRVAFGAELPHLVILDGSQYPDEALETCRQFCQLHPAIPLIGILTRSDLVERGAAWHNAGAQSFLRLDATRIEVETVLKSELKVTNLEHDLVAFKLQMIHYQQHDGDTQFLTRRRFFVEARRECRRARRYGLALSCIMININFFDDYNKTFGEACSIYVLKNVSTIMRRWTRESDIVARFANHKIVALLPETDISGAVMVRERILDAMDQFKFEWDDKPLPVSISIGEAERSHDFDSQLPDVENPVPIGVTDELAQLLEDADSALKVALKSAARPEMFIEYSDAELPPSAS